MARSASTDILDTFRFQIQVDQMIGRAGFVECTAPSMEIKMKEYMEAGRHMNPRKLTESATFPDITLKRGVSIDADFITWVQQVVNLNNYGGVVNSQGSSSVPPTSPTTNKTNNRRTIQIFQYDRTGLLAKTYVLYNCIPNLLQVASNFNAMEDALSMEMLKISYEGFDIIANSDGSVANQLSNSLSKVQGLLKD